MADVVKQKNGVGTAGFVLALIGLVFCWVPILNWILGVLGFILSFVGVFRKPKGLAIAGLIISLLAVITIIILLVAVGGIAAADALDLLDF